MLKQLYEVALRLLSLTQDTERNRVQIEELRREVKSLSSAVREIAFELRRLRENEAHEREKMVLRLENALLRFDRRLEPGRVDSGQGSSGSGTMPE